jgi:hypothetical protein
MIEEPVCGFFLTSLLPKCNEYQICLVKKLAFSRVVVWRNNIWNIKKLGFLRMVVRSNNVWNINVWWFHCSGGRYKLYSDYDTLWLFTQRFEIPNSSKELSQFQECWAVRNSSFFPTWAKIFFFSVAATQSFGPTQPHTQWVLGANPPEVKWQEPEAVDSPPSGAECKNAWSFISIPPYVFMV